MVKNFQMYIFLLTLFLLLLCFKMISKTPYTRDTESFEIGGINTDTKKMQTRRYKKVSNLAPLVVPPVEGCCTRWEEKPTAVKLNHWRILNLLQ